MSDAYIGVSTPNRVSAAFQKEDFLGSDLGNITVSGITFARAYALDTEVPGSNAENIMVVLDNVVQEPDVAFTIHEDANNLPKIISFSSAVLSTSTIYVTHRGIGSFSMKPPTGSVGPDQLTDTMKGFTTDTFVADGNTAAFTLTETPPNSNSVLVFVDGILQKITTNYTISGSTLTFTSNPANTSEIEVKHMGVRGVLRRGPDYIYDSFTGDGTDTTFTLTHTGVPTNNAFVFYNGVALKPTTDYSISGAVLTITFAPQSASEIMVRYQI